MVEELDGLWDKGMSEEGTPSQGTTPRTTLFAFTIERAVGWSIKSSESRLVASRYTQRSGVDFFELLTLRSVSTPCEPSKLCLLC